MALNVTLNGEARLLACFDQAVINDLQGHVASFGSRAFSFCETGFIFMALVRSERLIRDIPDMLYAGKSPLRIHLRTVATETCMISATSLVVSTSSSFIVFGSIASKPILRERTPCKA